MGMSDKLQTEATEVAGRAAGQKKAAAEYDALLKKIGEAQAKLDIIKTEIAHGGQSQGRAQGSRLEDVRSCMALVTVPLGANWNNDSRFVRLWTLTDDDATGDWLECQIGVGQKRACDLRLRLRDRSPCTGRIEPGTPTSSLTLRDVTHTALAFTGTNGEQILENTLKLRPVLSGAAGGTSVLVYLCVNGN